MSLDAFDRLTPSLRHHVVHTLGFTGLRPVQSMTIDAILDGDNCVVLAPTAGGKTEAAFLPLLSRMDAEDWGPPSVLYLSPIKALLNNQHTRLERLAGMISRRVFKWHGDVTPSFRKTFIADPADILMTTPESLEVMLISQHVPSRMLFSKLKAVVVDEVHAFAGDDRGAHLVALLERLQRHCGNDVQRIGLSATIGNPSEILGWLQGTSKRPRRLVDPPRPPATPKVTLDYVGTLQNAARLIHELHPGTKRLVFVDSRRRVEQLGEALQALHPSVFLMHSSLSVDERRQAEKAFEEGSNCIIVATSTMELGIDVGDLDVVFQIDAPPTVASFLQRMGRTGRRGNTQPNCTFLCTTDEELGFSAAILRLWAAGYVEPVRPERDAFHILAQQTLALCLQETGLPVSDWWAWLAGAACFSEVTEAERSQLLEHMLEQGILSNHDGRLWLGELGEKLYARRNFEALYAVFEARASLDVVCGPEEIGSIDAQFVQGLDPGSAFVLAGKAWKIVSVQWSRGRCEVVPAPQGQHATWFGGTRLRPRRQCEALREVLLDDIRDPWWTARAFECMRSYRSDHTFVHDEPQPFHWRRAELGWYTFAGGAMNNLLSRLLLERLGSSVTAGNLVVRLRDQAATSEAAVRDEARKLNEPGGVTAEDAMRLVGDFARERLSKFQPCLPEELERRFLARRVFGISEASGDRREQLAKPNDSKTATNV